MTSSQARLNPATQLQKRAAQTKLKEVWSLVVAWRILATEYGDKDDTRLKLKQKITALRPKATCRYERNMEIYNSLQYIHGRIVSAGALDMLESDVEYVRTAVRAEVV